MHRKQSLIWLAALGGLLPWTMQVDAQPKADKAPNRNKAKSEIYVTVKTRLYEVNAAFRNRLAKAKWLSKADLEELESKPPVNDPLFAKLAKQKPSRVGKVIDIDPGKTGMLLTVTKPGKYLPTPEQLRQGNRDPQTIHEGFTLNVQVHVSADRRFVRARLQEKNLEIEGIEQIRLLVDNQGNQIVGERISTKEVSVSQTRTIPDGASILLLLNYRSAELRKSNHWWVVEITPRIYIEEEERIRRGGVTKR